jgi:hypothetical protein
MSSQFIGQRQLNRALLARQLLLARARLTTEQAIEHLVGMQAQSPTSPYVGLWTRVDDFRFESLAQMLGDRRVVRLVLMRNTIHLVTADDAYRLRPLLAPLLERGFKSSPFGTLLSGLDLDPVVAAGRTAVDATPLTFAELGAALNKRWPAHDGQALAQAIRTHVALVQVPPRGIWGQGGQARHTSLEAWLGPWSGTGMSLDGLIRRYLAAFGPASVADMQKWSGLTRLREIVDRLGPQLISFRDGNGLELFDLPDAPRPSAETPAPIRYLAEFDNILLSHADRTRIVTEHDRAMLFTTNGIVPGAVLVDGMVRARWRIDQVKHRTATLTVVPFHRLSKEDSSAIAQEGRRLLEAAAAGPTSREVIVHADPTTGHS